MAVIMMDSFEWMNGTFDSSRYQVTGGSPRSVNTTPLFSGDYYLTMDSNEDIVYDLGAQSGGGIYFVGFFYRYRANGSTREQSTLFNIENASNAAQFTIWSDELGYLKWSRSTSGGTLLGTSTRRLLVEAWYHIEVKFAVKNSISANDCILKVDGEEQINLAATTDTQQQASDQFDQIQIANSSQADEQDYAYLYFLDDSGTYANDFLGPTARMEVLLPNGNGNYNDFTGSDADSTDNYLHVDEADADDDTSYVADDTVSDRDSYTMSNLTRTPLSSEIHAVQLLSRVKKTGGTESRTMKQFVRVSASDYDQTDWSLTDGTYETFVDLLTQNPDTTSQWTATEADALEVGIKVHS